MRSTRRPVAELPIGFAHRGARAECRDNTMASFIRALELGARGLESDVWLTADGVAVLDHDGVVRRGVRRLGIATLARAELPGHVPTFADLLAVAGDGVHISLDVKDPAAVEPVVRLVEAAGRAERTWLCGHGRRLIDWRALSAGVRLVDSTRVARLPDGLAARCRQLTAGGVDAVNLRWTEWSPDRLEVVHDRGLLAFAWDVQRPEPLAALVRMGVDAVYSDHVAMMVAALADAAR